MPQASFIHEGASIDYTPGANVAAGDVVVQGDLVGVAKLDILSGRLGRSPSRVSLKWPKNSESYTPWVRRCIGTTRTTWSRTLPQATSSSARWFAQHRLAT